VTREELKEQVKMPEVARRYGLKIVRGMSSCPFHGHDKHPSMKIYHDGFRCFTCGKYGDVIDFVVGMENISFKEAFKLLGGTYDVMTDEERDAENKKWQRMREKHLQQEAEEARLRKTLADAITYCRAATSWLTLAPLSEDWCFFINKLPILIGLWESLYINKQEVDHEYVYRQCESVRCYFHS